jgi:hypothetical protein
MVLVARDTVNLVAGDQGVRDRARGRDRGIEGLDTGPNPVGIDTFVIHDAADLVAGDLDPVVVEQQDSATSQSIRTGTAHVVQGDDVAEALIGSACTGVVDAEGTPSGCCSSRSHRYRCRCSRCPAHRC